MLTHFIGTLPPQKMKALNPAARVALGSPDYEKQRGFPLHWW
jgi:hypothetical protein